MDLEQIGRNTLNYHILSILEGQKELLKTELSKAKDMFEKFKLESLIEYNQKIIDDFKEREGIVHNWDYWDLCEILSD